MELQQDTRLFGNYTIEKTLDSGSFGIVYRAHDANRHTIAIKEFFLKDINVRQSGSSEVENSSGQLVISYKQKFISEANHLKSLSHKNIVKVHKIFKQNNTVYYSMDFIEGTNLDKRVDKIPMDESKALSLWHIICEAVRYMHEQSMLHLDIKPKNIMLREKDETPVLIDFGMSKIFDENGNPESSSGIGPGTDGYAPLEQSDYAVNDDTLSGKETIRSNAGQNNIPVTMDIYALGATLFKMLTGERPPNASVVLSNGIPQKKMKEKGVSRATRRLVKKAMSPKAEDRYQSVDDMIRAIPRNYVRKNKSKNRTEKPPIQRTNEEQRPPRPFPWKLIGTFCVVSAIAALASIELKRYFSPDEKSWRQAKNDGTVESYISYYTNNTSGRHRIDALTTILQLDNAENNLEGLSFLYNEASDLTIRAAQRDSINAIISNKTAFLEATRDSIETFPYYTDLSSDTQRARLQKLADNACAVRSMANQWEHEYLNRAPKDELAVAFYNNILSPIMEEICSKVEEVVEEWDRSAETVASIGDTANEGKYRKNIEILSAVIAK